MSINKAVIPVAGLGTRVLPTTLAVPKVMIPIYDRPSLHYCIEEAIDSGITKIILIISEIQEDIIKNYFSLNDSISDALKNKGHEKSLAEIEKILNRASVEFVIQKQPLGLGDAVLMAKKSIGETSFAVLLPDDLIIGNTPTLKHMLHIHSHTNDLVVAIKQVDSRDIPNLGIVSTANSQGEIHEIIGMVEKPSVEEAPSDLAIIGRYVLPIEIFDALERSHKGALGEIQLTDAIASLIPYRGCKGYLFQNAHFDVGTPLGLLQASLHQAVNRHGIDVDFGDWLNFSFPENHQRLPK